MRTLAHALIHRRYVERGETTRIVVLPVPGCGLPQRLVDAAQPVPLDLLAGRPTNLVLDDDGISVDLCFGGPAARCRFPWEAVMAVQGAEDEAGGPDTGVAGKLLQTLIVTVATVMEDHSIRPASAEHFASLAGAAESPAPGSSPPPDHSHTPRGPRPRGGRPRFQVITGKKG